MALAQALNEHTPQACELHRASLGIPKGADSKRSHLRYFSGVFDYPSDEGGRGPRVEETLYL